MSYFVHRNFLYFPFARHLGAKDWGSVDFVLLRLQIPVAQSAPTGQHPAHRCGFPRCPRWLRYDSALMSKRILGLQGSWMTAAKGPDSHPVHRALMCAIVLQAPRPSDSAHRDMLKGGQFEVLGGKLEVIVGHHGRGS
jgi:hypothetical protein